MFSRIHQAFLNAGLGEPTLLFSFSDSMADGSVSSVDRVLKRLPDMQRFLKTDSPHRGFPEMRRLCNSDSMELAPVSHIEAIVAGIPRSFPFHNATIHFHSPVFGEMVPGASNAANSVAGVTLSDSWWVSGRNRSLSAVTIVSGDAGSKKLPALPAALAAVLAACGKARRTVQVALPYAEAPEQRSTASSNPEAVQAVKAIVADYRGRLREIVERAWLPHELPPQLEALQKPTAGNAGPLKPTLQRVFKDLGYSCRGASGTFTLQRRTQGNLTAQLYLDVGTWSRNVTAIFRVLGMGFKASLAIPVALQTLGSMQYPIGDAERWQKIVENLAALVTELDQSLVPEIEQAAGPTPEWFEPEA